MVLRLRIRHYRVDKILRFTGRRYVTITEHIPPTIRQLYPCGVLTADFTVRKPLGAQDCVRETSALPWKSIERRIEKCLLDG